MMNRTRNKQIHEEVMRNLGLLYGKAPSEARQYAQDAINDSVEQCAPDDRDDATDDGR